MLIYQTRAEISQVDATTFEAGTTDNSTATASGATWSGYGSTASSGETDGSTVIGGTTGKSETTSGDSTIRSASGSGSDGTNTNSWSSTYSADGFTFEWGSTVEQNQVTFDGSGNSGSEDSSTTVSGSGYLGGTDSTYTYAEQTTTTTTSSDSVSNTATDTSTYYPVTVFSSSSSTSAGTATFSSVWIWTGYATTAATDTFTTSTSTSSSGTCLTLTTTESTWKVGVPYVNDTVLVDDSVSDAWCLAQPGSDGSTQGYFDEVYQKFSEGTVFNASDYLSSDTYSAHTFTETDSVTQPDSSAADQTLTSDYTQSSGTTSHDTAHQFEIAQAEITDTAEEITYGPETPETYTTTYEDDGTPNFRFPSTVTVLSSSTYTSTETFFTTATDDRLFNENGELPITQITSTQTTTAISYFTSTSEQEWPWLVQLFETTEANHDRNETYAGGVTQFRFAFQTTHGPDAPSPFEYVPVAAQGWQPFGVAGEITEQVYRALSVDIQNATDNIFQSSSSGSSGGIATTTVSDSISWLSDMRIELPLSLMQRDGVSGFVTRHDTFTVQGWNSDTYVPMTMKFADTGAISGTTAEFNVWVDQTTVGDNGVTSTHKIRLVISLTLGSATEGSDMTGDEQMANACDENLVFGGRKRIQGINGTRVRQPGVYWRTEINSDGSDSTTRDTVTDLETSSMDTDKLEVERPMQLIAAEYIRGVYEGGGIGIEQLARYA